MPLPTSDVQNNIFALFLDPENVGLAVGIAFLSALDPKLLSWGYRGSSPTAVQAW